MTAFAIFICISLVIGAAVHYRIRSYVLASAFAAFLSATSFVGIACALQRPGPLIGVAFIFAGIYAFGISLIAGIPVAVWRRRTRPPPPGHCQTCGYNLTGN